MNGKILMRKNLRCSRVKEVFPIVTDEKNRPLWRRGKPLSGAFVCCILAVLGTDAWPFLPDSWRVGVPGALLCALWLLVFFCAPALAGLCGASRALPLCVPAEPRSRLPSAFYPLLCLCAFLGGGVATAVSGLWCEALAWLGLTGSGAVTPPPAGAAQVLASLLMLCLLPAIAEEFLFRGVLLPAMGPSRRAIALTAAAFALLHPGLESLPVSFPVGLLLGALALKTGALVPAFVYHACHNASVLLLNWTASGGWTIPRSSALLLALPWAALLYSLLKPLPALTKDTPEPRALLPLAGRALAALLAVRLALAVYLLLPGGLQ